jgi:hypothetical protein
MVLRRSAQRFNTIYQQGLAGECALRFEPDKTRLDDDRHQWDWWPPGWACAFEQHGRRWERHLW